ncbi:MAG: DUF4350 domain-containing protein [Planctomycetota bacterium]
MIPQTPLLAQQVADREFKPRTMEPRFESGHGPVVAIDQAHHNFHTAAGRYSAFAKVIRADGYRVTVSNQAFSEEALAGVDLLLIANALAEENEKKWSLPTPSAFEDEEIDALAKWIDDGGRLLLIADHMPFPGAASKLGKRLGIDDWSNGFAGLESEDGAGNVKLGNLRFQEDSGLVLKSLQLGKPFRETEIKWVESFTGSAFLSSQEWLPVMELPPTARSLEPNQAWKFNSTTKVADVAGWHQGAVRKLGKGRIAAFGEAAMFTAQNSGSGRGFGLNSEASPYNQDFLRQVVAWLVDGIPGKR